MIDVTPSAAAQIRELVPAGDRAAKGLRLFVEKGGCSGLSYGMNIDGRHEGDLEIPCEDVRVFLDAESTGYLKGSKLDYEDGLTSRGFKLINPNAKQTCGCGTSFEA
jgi:iron-sulfur cluster assembly accessory protein